jgi:trehalose 6-phosphate synthase
LSVPNREPASPDSTSAEYRGPFMAERPIVIASNRGPVSFAVTEDGSLQAKRGAGGLVSGLSPLVRDTETIWIAAAISEGDRFAAQRGVVETEGFRVRALDIDRETYRLAYDVICNETLWFVHHGLYDLPRQPSFDRAWREAWAAYRSVNRTFADAVAESSPEGAVVLVQDYHLTLLGQLLADRRPDLATVHFSHTPFASPDWLRVLPPDIVIELITGMSGHHACGFHTERWAAAFRASARSARTFVSPLASDPDDIRSVAASADCTGALEELEAAVGDRMVIARVDRVELSKNVLRGFAAYDALLEEHPEWRERVVFAAAVYPSREGVAAYREYGAAISATVAAINRRWGTPGWEPILLDVDDDHPRSVALLRRADVLLVNPVRDGLNLVAKEGALINERDAVLVLSTQAGAWDELRDLVIGIHPFDVAATADALDTALRLPRDERAKRAAELRHRAESRTPRDWLAEQLAAADMT